MDGEMPTDAPAKGGRPVTNGLSKLRAAVTTLGTRRLDGRTQVAQAIRRWKQTVTDDLGGVEALSEAQRTILESAAQKLILRDSLGAWLAQRATLVRPKSKTCEPVVRDFLQVSDSLARDLERLGLERKARPVPTLAEYLAQKAAEASPPAP